MDTDPLKPGWLRKRILLPLLSSLLLAASLTVAVIRSGTSTVVVYNNTGAPLPPLRIEACGQARLFPALAEKESVRMRLDTTGSESEVKLELATEPAWRWSGGFVEPRGGYRLTVRLYPDGQVETDTQLSIWRRLFKGS
jgi:hypothetical protein